MRTKEENTMSPVSKRKLTCWTAWLRSAVAASPHAAAADRESARGAAALDAAASMLMESGRNVMEAIRERCKNQIRWRWPLSSNKKPAKLRKDMTLRALEICRED